MKNTVEKLVACDKKMWSAICPCCGKSLELVEEHNALSRYADVVICSDCGMVEAMNDAVRKPVSFQSWVIYKELLEGIVSREGRKKFIVTCENGIYSGANIDGEAVVVFNDNANGLIVKTIHASKPNWWEVVEFDVDGFQESVSYEAVEG